MILGFTLVPMDTTSLDALEPGDWCDDCRTYVASDGECECNQDDDIPAEAS